MFFQDLFQLGIGSHVSKKQQSNESCTKGFSWATDFHKGKNYLRITKIFSKIANYLGNGLG
jgi:hypothetical protein